MDKHSASDKKHRLRKGMKKGLCAAFAVVAISGWVGGAAAGAVYELTAPAGQPNTVQAFDMTATRDPFRYVSNWGDMMQRHQADMQDPAKARQFNDYLATFDKYKSGSFDKMARDVNDVITKSIKYYNDYPNSSTYWLTPYTTESTGRGNCHDYASLQYFILRHLGMPENRMLLALVNDNGQTTETNHAVLLVNIAPEGQKPDFIVLNYGPPIFESTDYARPQGANAGWPKPYVLFVAFNDKGVWTTRPEDAQGMYLITDQAALTGILANLVVATGVEAARLQRAALPGIAEVPQWSKRTPAS